MNRRKLQFKWRVIGPYIAVSPGLLFLVSMALYPLIFSLKISLFKWNLLDPQHYFVGFLNFQRIMSDPDFWHAIMVTFIFTFVTVTAEFSLGLAIALILNREIRGGRVFQTLLLLPIVMAPAIVGLMWRFMLNYEYGVINYFLTLLQLPRIAWLAIPSLALPSLIITDVWQWTPFMTLILLAGLQSLPDEPLEAAAIDGCSRWQSFWYVTLPMLKQVAIIAIVLRIIDAFRIYDIIYMMTRGGPVNATASLSWTIYERGFTTFDLDKGAAMSWIMLVCVVAIITATIKLTRFHESEL